VTFILGQLFNLLLDLRQYVVAKLALGRKNIIAARPIPIISGKTMIITSMVIDPHKAVI